MLFSLVLLLLCSAGLSFAKIVTYNWNIEWVTAAPDGFARPVIGINGKWPCPQVDVDTGDRLIVTIHNGLGNQSTGIHWHGIHQNGTNVMDGASGVNQCPVPPGHSFTYDFTVTDQVGTYWYHSHNMGQYPDGLWGPFIIHDPKPPFHFDEELTLTFSDWYHEQMPELIYQYQSYSGEAADGTPTPTGGSLINSGKNVSIPVKPNKTYYIHIICPSSYQGIAWIFDSHPMTVVEVDGIYVDPVSVGYIGNMTRIAPGQRWGVLVTTKNDTSRNYAIWDSMDVNMLFINKGIIPPPKDYNTNATAWLVYNESAPLPDPPVFSQEDLTNTGFFDDLTYVPSDHEPILEPVDHQIILDTNSANISGVSRFTVNNYTYLGQKVPTLYSALTVGGNYSSNPLVYSEVNPFIIAHNSIVEIVINNLNTNLHPWHLHGHQFQVLERTPPSGGSFNGTYGPHQPYPAKRDTIMLQDKGYAIIRFRADNPGVWLIHCHIEFHTVSGFMATIIEAPETFHKGQIKPPADHIEACKAYPLPYKGNAAGNTKDPLDLTGAVTTVDAYDHGAEYPPDNSTSAKSRKRDVNLPYWPRERQARPLSPFGRRV